MANPRLEIKNLAVSFDTFAGKVQAVRNVSFSLERGETLAIVGESGSGKTVTCRAMMRLLAKNASFESGEILLDGTDILKLPVRKLRNLRGSDISMIFQDPMTSLDPTMRIGRQIEESITLHRRIGGKEARRRTVELLDLVGIGGGEKRRRQYPHEFSGGQRQRIVIAMALACEPKVLIADEPTTALDVTMQAQIIDLFKDLQNRFSTSIIFITHDLGVVANVADRVAVMYAGKIVEIGEAAEIFYDPRHPYTWGLLNSMPTLALSSGVESEAEAVTHTLNSIPGTPPSMVAPPVGDAFAPRNAYALEVDTRFEPPFFKVSDTHYAATWLMDPRAPKVAIPPAIQKRRESFRQRVSLNDAAL